MLLQLATLLQTNSLPSDVSLVDFCNVSIRRHFAFHSGQDVPSLTICDNPRLLNRRRDPALHRPVFVGHLHVDPAGFAARNRPLRRCPDGTRAISSFFRRTSPPISTWRDAGTHITVCGGQIALDDEPASAPRHVLAPAALLRLRRGIRRELAHLRRAARQQECRQHPTAVSGNRRRNFAPQNRATSPNHLDCTRAISCTTPLRRSPTGSCARFNSLRCGNPRCELYESVRSASMRCRRGSSRRAILRVAAVHV